MIMHIQYPFSSILFCHLYQAIHASQQSQKKTYTVGLAIFATRLTFSYSLSTGLRVLFTHVLHIQVPQVSSVASVTQINSRKIKSSVLSAHHRWIKRLSEDG